MIISKFILNKNFYYKYAMIQSFKSFIAFSIVSILKKTFFFEAVRTVKEQFLIILLNKNNLLILI